LLLAKEGKLIGFPPVTGILTRDMSIQASDKAAVCAVVVTYFPPASCAQHLTAIASQVGKLLIVDNGSSEESLQPVVACAPRLGASLVRLGANRGVAAALNVGVRFAAECGCAWLATFDQDSEATPGMIEEMLRVVQSHPDVKHVGVVSPRRVDPRSGFTVREPGGAHSSDAWRAIPTTMTSGSLVNLAAIALVGGFEDALFIDYVDHEFCLRLRRHGYRIVEASRARLLHSLGALERRRFIFKRISVTHHATVRRYYMTRNRLILWRRYWRREPRWVLGDVRRFLSETLFVLLYEKQAHSKVAMVWRGLRDGAKSIGGPFAA